MRMSFFWGDTPMAYARFHTLASFRKHNPEWEMVLYTAPYVSGSAWDTTERQDFDSYEGEDWREHLDELDVRVIQWDPPVAATPNQQADICRWQVLAEGGMFADMDIAFFRPMTSLHTDALMSGSAFTCVDGVLSLGLTGSAGTKLCTDAYHHSILMSARGDYQCAGVDVLYDMALGDKAWATVGHPDWNYIHSHDTLAALDATYGGVVNIPKSWVHPAHFAFPFKNVTMPPDSIGVHWYAGAPAAREVIDNWTPGSTPPGILGEAVCRSRSGR